MTIDIALYHIEFSKALNILLNCDCIHNWRVLEMAEQQPENPCGGPMGFITIVAMMFVVMIMFDPGLGKSIVKGMGYLMEPITFNDGFPIWTIFLSGLILVIITTSIRHKFSNWYEMAKTQKIQAAFNKELREATMSGNQLKAGKLRELQPEMMKLTNQLMMNNMKTMIFTMVVAILIWRWLYSYLDTIEISFISLPWAEHWPMTQTLKSFCPVPFPYWIAIYFIISVPIGQVLVSMFKVIEFSKDAKQAEEAREDTVREKLTSLEVKLRSAKQEGVNTVNVESIVTKIRENIAEAEFANAERMIENGENNLEQAVSNRRRAVETLETTRNMIDAAKTRGVNVSSIQATLSLAEAALARNDHTKTIQHCKQCQERLKLLKDKHSEAENAMKSLSETVSGTSDEVQKIMTQKMQSAENAMDSRSYDEVMDQVKKLKSETDNIQRKFENARELIENARELKAELTKLSIDIGRYEDKLRNAEDKYSLGDYGAVIELAGDVNEELLKLKKLYEEASESVNFAKLIVANAQNFGADVTVAQQLLAEAEMALSEHNYSSALAKATNAKGLAEDAKKQIQRKQKRS